MTLNFYTLGVLYLVYSFLGWVGETVVATFRGKRFANRGMAAGPFCFVYGTTAILMAVGFADMRTKPVALFVACMLTATVVEWLTAKLLERLHNRKWWDYSDKKFNLNGYVCLQYSVLWGLLGMASVLCGLGVTNLSMSASAMPAAKADLAAHSYAECRELAQRLLKTASAEEAEEIFAEWRGE